MPARAAVYLGSGAIDEFGMLRNDGCERRTEKQENLSQCKSPTTNSAWTAVELNPGFWLK
jgi:hypothetical protein